MRITAISDPHGNFPVLDPGDILLVGGDLVNRGDEQEYSHGFLPWLIKTPFKHKVFVAGNHDRWLFKNQRANMGLPPDCHYLLDSEVNCGGVRIWGTPWTTPFCNWYFMEPDFKLADRFSAIPEGIDILLSHGPRYGVCDMFKGIRTYDIFDRPGEERKGLGSHALRTAVNRVKPKWHISGHIHMADHTPAFDGVTRSVCVSILDDAYAIAHPAFVFDYTPGST